MRHVLPRIGVLTLACVAGLLAMVTPDPAAAQDARITALAVREVEDRAELVLTTSQRAEWSARALGASEIMLTIPNATLDPAVSDLNFPDGLIESVEAIGQPVDDTRTVIVLVTLRGVRSYSIVAEEGALRVILRPRTAPEPEPAAATDAAADDGGESAADETAGVAVADRPAEAPASEMVAPETVDSATVDSEMVASAREVPEVEAPETAASEIAAPEMPGGEEELLAALGPEPMDPAFAATDAASGEYRIGPGDVLEISVFGLDEFDRTVRVLRDGSISLPLLGGLQVAGMSLQEAQAAVATMLSGRQLVNEPQVSFFVKEYVSRGVSIQGAVVKPGVYQMIQQRSLLEMLGEAGGLSGSSSSRAGQQIFIIRKNEAGEQRRIEINAEELINQGRADLNIMLRPADVVLVPFAQTNRVYVSGAVAKPGPVEYLSSEGITVLQAITAAGGPSERGNLSNVKIVRTLADGTEERIEVNAKKIQKGKVADVALERNDTVIVGEWFF